ncbi:MAG: Gfo/Idh/MocA family oxidoreductase [Verrucomicrobiota bacterium]
MNTRLKTGIIGAGRIAQGFDSPGDRRVLTLAHAVAKSKRLIPGGFFDSRPARAQAAEKKWNCPAGPRDREVWLDAGWDVFFIATPDGEHARDLADILKRRPKAVLVEKPLALDGRIALRLLKRAKQTGIPVLVDFPRRQHSGCRRIGEMLVSGELGVLLQARGIYSGGLKHNGVHLLDVLFSWCGPVGNVRLMAKRSGMFWLEMQTRRGPVALTLCEARQTGCYIWELCCDTNKARVELAGAPEILKLYRGRGHSHYPEFTVLQEKRSWPVDGEPLLARTVEHLARLAGDPAATRAHLDLEIERQRFFNKVFQLCKP